jgi:hypothetical protein
MDKNLIFAIIIVLVPVNIALMCYDKDGFNSLGKFIIASASIIVILSFIFIVISFSLNLFNIRNILN